MTTPPADPRHVSGFSKFTKEQKRRWIRQTYLDDAAADFATFDYPDEQLQTTLDGFSENTIANFPLPLGVAPNFVINGRTYAVPMVTEESSVVAAAGSAAKYWAERGGFRAEVVATTKIGQLHFCWGGNPDRRAALLPALIERLTAATKHLTERMTARGGGITSIEWLHLPAVAKDFYQLHVSFDSRDSMGANFINSVLEQYGASLSEWSQTNPDLIPAERKVEVIMAILSNYTPDCRVRAWVESDIEVMNVAGSGVAARDFCRRFELAVRIATEDPYRAVTHNKGIMNGIDAVVLATANDFRAIEAGVNAYAARDGQYRSLSSCILTDTHFRFELEVPLALGTVGGLTRLHPLAARSLEILGNPSAEELMQIVAATGLAQNFAALRSLVTTGIQKGHMKMHLQNILRQQQASARETQAATAHFSDRVISYQGVREFLAGLR